MFKYLKTNEKLFLLYFFHTCTFYYGTSFKPHNIICYESFFETVLDPNDLVIELGEKLRKIHEGRG